MFQGLSVAQIKLFLQASCLKVSSLSASFVLVRSPSLCGMFLVTVKKKLEVLWFVGAGGVGAELPQLIQAMQSESLWGRSQVLSLWSVFAAANLLHFGSGVWLGRRKRCLAGTCFYLIQDSVALILWMPHLISWACMLRSLSDRVGSAGFSTSCSIFQTFDPWVNFPPLEPYPTVSLK